jgi:hypothetical protein
MSSSASTAAKLTYTAADRQVTAMTTVRDSFADSVDISSLPRWAIAARVAKLGGGLLFAASAVFEYEDLKKRLEQCECQK